MPVDRLLPQSLEMEQAVLGSMLINPESVIPVVTDILTGEEFIRIGHRHMFEAIELLDCQQRKIDILTVQEVLRNDGTLETLPDGAGYFITIMNSVAATANADHYARVVREKWIIRRGLESLARLETLYWQADAGDAGSLDDLIVRAQEIQDDVAKPVTRSTQLATPETLTPQVLAEFEHAWTHKRDVTGISTGLHALDVITCGFQEGDLIVIAGRPGMGKTALATQIMVNCARHHGAVLLATLEMSGKELWKRAVASEADVDSTLLKTGHVSEAHKSAVREAGRRVHRLPIHITDQAVLTVPAVRAYTRRLLRDDDLKLVIVDYLGLMTGHARTDNRTQEVDTLITGLKRLAQETRVPVVVLSQLSREVEKMSDKRPTLAHLRESGGVEAAANVVLFPFVPGYYKRDEERTDDIEDALIDVAKQRNGPSGEARVRWKRKATKFFDRAPAYREAQPGLI